MPGNKEKAFDYKKEFKELYQPKTKPTLIDVPVMQFLMVDGTGDPNQSPEYQEAVEILYGLSYTIKMSKKSGIQPDGYFDYVVPPLEGLWWLRDDEFESIYPMDKTKFCWTSMIRQPDFVTPEFLSWAVRELNKKKPHFDTSRVRLESFCEGLCVQMMHIGPYETEAQTIKQLDDFIFSQGYVNAISDRLPSGQIRRHHEIYLAGPGKTAAAKMKTVIRHPVKLGK